MSFNVGFVTPVRVLNLEEETISEIAENTDLVLAAVGKKDDEAWDGKKKEATIISLLKSIVNTM